MFTKMFGYFALSLLLLLGNSSGNSAPQTPGKSPEGQTGTMERMVVATGNVAMDLDLDRLRGISSGTQESKLDTFRFEVGPNSFFVIRVLNNDLRGPEPSSMGLVWRNSAALPELLNASSSQLVIEQTPSGEPFELVVRDGKTGFVFFNIEGHLYEYDAAAHLLSINGGRLLVSEELAKRLGHPAQAGLNVGQISISATMYPIEVTTFVNGAATSSMLPPRPDGSPNVPEGSVPGPDIVVGDMSGLAVFGSTTTQVGMATGATSCNNGDQPVHFYQIPNPDHSVVSQNFYRMSGGPSNNDRFEQLGQSWVKHTFGASQENACSFGCTPFPDQSELGVGCSDPYAASQNANQNNTNSGALGSRAWVNAYTGAFSVNPRPENHTGHTHTGTSHRIVVDKTDLNTTMNVGATYYLEVQYDSPNEYAWCQVHAGQCNMYNNASYRRYNVTGTTSFTFASVGATVRMTPATGVWTGATSSTIEPEPGVDGRAFVVYKVTGPVAGIWHYEYAIHNQNLDRSVQSFSVPLGCGITVSNTGFHAPPNHPGFANDGTVGNTGFSNVAWTPNQTLDSLSWNTETFAQNPNANAVRFGTMYNFRFDSDRPPQAALATVGFLKTGAPITVAIQGPAPDVCTGVTPTPAPTVTPTPTATATPAATPTPSASASPSATPVATPTPSASASPSATPCSSNMIVDGGFENGGIPSSTWDPETSTAFGTPLCDFASCGNGGGASPPRTGLIWAWFGGVPAPETSTLGQTVTIPSGGPATLHFWMRIGAVNTPFTDVLNVRVDGAIVQSFPEPATAEAAYTERVIDLSAFANGASHALLFEYIGPSTATGSYTVDDVSLIAGNTCASPAQAVNLSTRMRVGTDENVGIGGFIITGVLPRAAINVQADGNTAPKHVLIRAIGPSLGQSVPDALADPVLELHGPGGFVTVTNNNWRDDPAQEALIIASGIPPTNDLESAIDAVLNPGAYTAIVRGNNNTSGVALVEVYDLDSAVLAKLANISTRAFVGTADNIVIAGFMLGNGNGDDRVVVRGLGASNALQDPTLELRNADGALVRSDNDWQDDSAQAAAITSVGLAPPSPLDAAIFATLPPGIYTALLAGRNGGTGVGLVEVYDLGSP